MLNKGEIKNIIKVGLILFAITAISAFVLAGVNAITEPIIANNNAIKEKEAMQKVLPDVTFMDENLAQMLSNTDISAIYEAKNKDNENAGYVVMLSSNGYGGAISMVVGINADFTVSGIDIISQSETPSLGARCIEDDFKARYVGKMSGIEVVKNGATGNSIDAISGATVTSKAVTKGVNTAIEAVELIAGGK